MSSFWELLEWSVTITVNKKAGCFCSLLDIDIELVISEGVYLILTPVPVGCDTFLWFVTVESWHRSMSGGSGVNLNIIKTRSPGRWTLDIINPVSEARRRLIPAQIPSQGKHQF